MPRQVETLQTQWPGGFEKKMTLKKEKIKSSLKDLGMPHKVAKQQVTLACSNLVILTDDLDEEYKTGMTQAHTRGQDWHYTNTHTQLVATATLYYSELKLT